MKLHYVGMMLLIPVYGVQVCPFVESLTPLEVFATIDIALLGTWLLRHRMREWLLARTAEADQAWRIFALELGLLLACAVTLGAYNVLVHDFPAGSAAKVLLGFLAMGLFASTDAALAHERFVAAKVEREERQLEISGEFFPLTSKLALCAGAYVLVVVGIFSLLVIKDLDWMVTIGAGTSLAEARVAIVKEFGFVFAVILIESVNIILSFMRNLNLFLRRENAVLARVSGGHYDGRVPVSSNDEFGIMAVHTNEMIARICERSDELNRTRDATILALASLAEARDNETGAHILRTQRYVRALAMQLRNHPRFSAQLDDDTITLLYKSAPLHDIGKVGIPDAILLKPGKLTDDEFEVMKGHAQIGADALKVTEEELGDSSFLQLAREISLTHHEKWNGTGYPSGLSGDAIPLSGRLMAVADVYDALISKRVYKPAFSHDKAMQIICAERGRHFDPDVIDALQAIESEFRDIAQRYADVRYLEQMQQAS